MKIFYLNPPYVDLSIERDVIHGTAIELVPCSVEDEDDVVERIHDADAILTAHVPITARIAASLDHCKVVIKLGVGYEIIDVAACKERGIVVCNVPDYGAQEVANHAHAMFFAVHRRLLNYDRNVRAGRWGYELPWPIARLSTLRIGVLGLGRIGSAFARGIAPFVREVVAYDPFLGAEQFRSNGLLGVSLDEVYETCDAISLHLPLTQSNLHLIGDATIAKMKRQPIIVNVSRGGLIDSSALARGLRSGQISGAGIDVFEDEPNVPTELLGLENIVLSPHVAWYSEEANIQLRRSAIEEIIRVFSGDAPHNPVT